MTILLTLCGRTKLQCNSKHTGGSAAGKRARIRSPAINHAQNTPSNSMFGLASYRGTTKLCIFDGIMNAELYIQILEECLVPFLNQVYPNGHRFMQNNDPKHTSRRAQAFFSEQNINWWRTPPESPDANPIKNLWHELKVNAHC